MIAKEAIALLYKPFSYSSSTFSMALASFCSSKNISVADIITVDEESSHKEEIYALAREIAACSQKITLVTNKKT